MSIIYVLLPYVKSYARRFVNPRLFDDECVCVARKNHPAFVQNNKLSFKSYLQFPHILVSFKDDPSLDVTQIAMAMPPFKLTNPIVKQVWHSQRHNDQAHQWLRNIFKEVMESCVSPNLSAPTLPWWICLLIKY